MTRARYNKGANGYEFVLFLYTNSLRLTLASSWYIYNLLNYRRLRMYKYNQLNKNMTTGTNIAHSSLLTSAEIPKMCI